MALPNFLIVGAPRSGTTSLYRYLREHPQVFLPTVKEPGFFAEGEACKVASLEEYAGLFDGTRAKAIGEASVTYLYDAGAAGRIRDVLGVDTRILILLRNPVDKTRSLWAHMMALAAESLAFEDALAAEEERLSGTRPLPPGTLAPTYYAYVTRGRYAPQVRRYFETFSRERVRVEIFEEFFGDPASAYRGVCAFLGVDSSHRPPFRVHNPSGAAYSQKLGVLLNRRSRWKEPLKAVVPLALRDRALQVLNRWNTRGGLPPLTEEVRERVQRYFEDDVRNLEVLLGRSLRDVWW
jgi:hypothetical protein